METLSKFNLFLVHFQLTINSLTEYLLLSVEQEFTKTANRIVSEIIVFITS